MGAVYHFQCGIHIQKQMKKEVMIYAFNGICIQEQAIPFLNPRLLVQKFV